MFNLQNRSSHQMPPARELQEPQGSRQAKRQFGGNERCQGTSDLWQRTLQGPGSVARRHSGRDGGAVVPPVVNCNRLKHGGRIERVGSLEKSGESKATSGFGGANRSSSRSKASDIILDTYHTDCVISTVSESSTLTGPHFLAFCPVFCFVPLVNNPQPAHSIPLSRGSWIFFFCSTTSPA